MQTLNICVPSQSMRPHASEIQLAPCTACSTAHTLCTCTACYVPCTACSTAHTRCVPAASEQAYTLTHHTHTHVMRRTPDGASTSLSNFKRGGCALATQRATSSSSRCSSKSVAVRRGCCCVEDALLIPPLAELGLGWEEDPVDLAGRRSDGCEVWKTVQCRLARALRKILMPGTPEDSSLAMSAAAAAAAAASTGHCKPM